MVAPAPPSSIRLLDSSWQRQHRRRVNPPAGFVVVAPAPPKFNPPAGFVMVAPAPPKVNPPAGFVVAAPTPKFNPPAGFVVVAPAKVLEPRRVQAASGLPAPALLFAAAQAAHSPKPAKSTKFSGVVVTRPALQGEAAPSVLKPPAAWHRRCATAAQAAHSPNPPRVEAATAGLMTWPAPRCCWLRIRSREVLLGAAAAAAAPKEAVTAAAGQELQRISRSSRCPSAGGGRRRRRRRRRRSE